MRNMTGTTGKSADAENAVRRYLLMLSDPDSLRDEVAVQQLQQKLAQTTDPLEKLSLLSTIERAGSVDVHGIRAEFHRLAQTFAQSNEVTAGAFAAMGVPREDLRMAGLLGPVSRGTTTPAARSSRSGRRLSVGDVVAAVPAGEFTVKQLEEASGASTLTVRKALDALLADGSLQQLEPDPGYTGPGRAPRRYRRS